MSVFDDIRSGVRKRQISILQGLVFAVLWLQQARCEGPPRECVKSFWREGMQSSIVASFDCNQSVL